MKIAFLGSNPENIEKVYAREHRARLAEVFDVLPACVGADDLESWASDLKQVQVVFSTWGMFKPQPEQVARMKALKILFYGAGSVRGFAAPFFENRVRISSAWRANGEVVAEFAMAQILLACKGYFGDVRDYRAGRPAHSRPGMYAGSTVALLGCGAVARHLIRMLRALADLTILVYDPYLEAESALDLGVVKAELSTCFESAHVVSNHMPDISETKNILSGPLFSCMREHATFINTGRGASIDNEGFLNVFSNRTDLTALLDVTNPEPLPADSLLFRLPNVHVSRHIAGAIQNERRRLGDRMIDHFYHWLRTGTLRDEITPDMLEHMA